MSDDAGSRWYTPENVERGAVIFTDNCAACHGKEANGHFTWRQRGPDGKFPPPPLNGTGHAWHHPTQVLAKQIKFGTPGGQGTMPGFAGILSDKDIVDSIAWFQSLWPDKTYDNWRQIEGRARSQ
jgi:mono/diheme cytochrome c family protein